MRLDRLVSLAVIRPALQIVNGRARQRIPILMYHEIQSDRGNRHPYYETATSPQTFVAHMRFLRDNGYTAINVREATQYLKAGSDNRRRVVLTFDDAYRDFYTAALPILGDFGFTATVFVVSGFATTVPPKFAGKEFMTWNQVRDVHARGFEIGSHTVSHPELWKLDKNELEHELVHSKSTIESEIGTTIESFSHPFAFPEHDRPYLASFSTILKQAGYRQAVSTIIGTAGPEYQDYAIPRLPANDYDDLRLFRAKLEGAYDWLHVAQSAYKASVKSRLQRS